MHHLFKRATNFTAFVAVFVLVTACGEPSSLYEDSLFANKSNTNLPDKLSRAAPCSVIAESLHAAKAEYARTCSLPRRDCDPIGQDWICSSAVIGDAAPPVHPDSPVNPGDESADVCSATGPTFHAAKAEYARTCSLPRRDCDPIGQAWICSSTVIGDAAPNNGSDTPDGEDSLPFITGFTLAAQWNELALAAVRAGSARPTVTTWQMFVVSAAVYDAVAMYTPDSLPYALDASHRRPASEFNDANRREAASQAAYQVLTRLFAEYEQDKGYFRTYMTAMGYSATTAIDHSAASIGYQAAIAVLDARANDGSNAANDFEPITSLVYPDFYEPVNSPDPIDSAGIFGQDFNPNKWQPLRVPNGTVLNEDEIAVVDNLNINSFGDQEFLTSHWGGVTPFALTHGAQFRPVAPPLLNSDALYTDALGVQSTNDAAYRRQIEEVLFYSANLTDRLKVIAEFWADGPRTESPPGHWNQIAHGVIERDNLDLVASSQLFFALNGALLDAGIATWEAKRYYDYIRPASAIRWLYQNQQIQAWGGPNKATQTILGQDWSPYQTITFVTPPFPEYVSGHSTFSRAAAEVLTRFTGSERFYDGITTTLQDVNGDGQPDRFGEHIAVAGSFFIEQGPVEDVVLQWDTYIQAADEAGKSRLYGGIHIQDGDLRGRKLGRQIGENAFDRAMSYALGNNQ